MPRRIQKTLQRIASCVASTVLCSTVCSSAGAQSPQLLSLQIPGSNVKLEMVYLPGGKFLPGPPKSAGDTADGGLIDVSKELPPFYISTTEVTFAQLAAALPKEDFETIRQRINSTTSKDQATNDYLRQAVDSDKMPAFAVSFKEVLAYCTALNQSLAAERAAAVSIERYRFRVPSQAEWQYACASKTAENTPLPHFNKWVDLDALDKNDRALITEEWAKLYPGGEAVTGTQDEILQMVDKLLAGDAVSIQNGQKILSVYFKAALGINRDFSKQVSRLNEIATGRPNVFSIYDLHDNVCEWVIKIDDPKAFRDFWDSIQTQEGLDQAAEKPFLVLAGGGFTQAASAKGMWKQFAVWGGYPMNPDSVDITPWNVSVGLDSSEKSQTVEYFPGIRLVMDRLLRPDWFAVVRGEVKKSSIDPKQFDTFETTVREIATATEQERVLPYLAAYRTLSEIKRADSSSAQQRFADSMSAVAAVKLVSATTKQKSSLQGLKIGGGLSSGGLKPKPNTQAGAASPSDAKAEDPAQTENSKFFNLAAELGS